LTTDTRCGGALMLLPWQRKQQQQQQQRRRRQLVSLSRRNETGRFHADLIRAFHH